MANGFSQRMCSQVLRASYTTLYRWKKKRR